MTRTRLALLTLALLLGCPGPAARADGDAPTPPVLPPRPTDAQVIRFAARHGEARELDIEDPSALTARGFEALAALPLSGLDLRLTDQGPDPAAMAALKRSRTLECLALSGPVRAEHVRAFAGARFTLELYLDHSSAAMWGACAAAPVDTLWISAPTRPLTDRDLRAIGGLTRLVRLGLARLEGATRDGLLALAGLTRLEDLSVGHAPAFDDICAARIASACPALDGVSLTGVAVRREGLAALARCPKLVSLDLVDMPITDDDLAALAAARQLDRLYLSELAELEGPGFRALVRLPIESLHVSECPKLNARAIAHIGALVSLERLELRACRALRGADLAPLAALSRLQALELRELGSTSLPALARCARLRELVVSGCDELPEQALASLGSLPALEQLQVSFCRGLTPAALGRLAARRGAPALALDVASSDLTDAHLAALHGATGLASVDLMLPPAVSQGAVDALRRALGRTELTVTRFDD